MAPLRNEVNHMTRALIHNCVHLACLTITIGCGPKPPTSLPVQLLSKDPKTRVQAALLIREKTERGIHPDADEIANNITSIIAALRDPDIQVRVCALDTLRNLSLLGELRIGKEAVTDIIVPLLSGNEVSLRNAACIAAREIDVEAEKVVPLLRVMILKETDILSRCSAIRALQGLEYDFPAGLEAIKHVLYDETNTNVKNVISCALEAFGHFNKSVEGTDGLGLVLRRLEDEDAGVRYSAVRAITHMAKDNEEILSALTMRLRDRDDSVKTEAACRLIELGADIEWKVLLPLLCEPVCERRMKVICAACVRGGELRANAVGVAVGDTDKVVRALGCYFANMGSVCEVGRLRWRDLFVDLVRDSEANVRSRAVIATGLLGGLGCDAGSVLVEALNDVDGTVRVEARIVLASGLLRKG